jgi:hypothetical protein
MDHAKHRRLVNASFVNNDLRVQHHVYSRIDLYKFEYLRKYPQNITISRSHGKPVVAGQCRYSGKYGSSRWFRCSGTVSFPLDTKQNMEGPLSKWTNVVNGWQYRWFVLDENAGTLWYYTVSYFLLYLVH